MAGRSEPNAAERVERELTLLVRRAQRVHLHSEDGPQPLERAAYAILARLHDDGPCRPGALAESLHLTASTISRQVQSLVAAGLVRREPDPRDARACRVELTASGRTALTRTRALRRRLVRQLLDTWSRADVETLATLLERLNTGIAGVAAKDTPPDPVKPATPDSALTPPSLPHNSTKARR